MERSLIAFSAGKRICLGQHIAWLEMKKLIPRLLEAYKVRFLQLYWPEPQIQRSRFPAC
jgi:cytochrome P450